VQPSEPFRKISAKIHFSFERWIMKEMNMEMKEKKMPELE